MTGQEFAPMLRRSFPRRPRAALPLPALAQGQPVSARCRLRLPASHLGRAVDAPDGAPVPVAWTIAEDEGMQPRRAQAAPRPPRRAGRTRCMSMSTGLRPGRPYWYRFTANGQASPVGRTRTAPAPTRPAAGAALRLRLVPAVRAGLLRRLPAHGGRGARRRCCSSATTSTRCRGAAIWCAITPAAAARCSTNIASATRSTNPTPTCRPRTPRIPGSSPGTTTR